MRRTIRPNILVPYSLHDMRVIEFEVNDNTLIMRTQSGMTKTTEPYGQPDGYVEFHKVDWDFCYAYTMDILANEGEFSGRKMSLQDFIAEFENSSFEVIDETFGYNSTKFSGWLLQKGHMQECIIELYHLGDMVYVTEEFIPLIC